MLYFCPTCANMLLLKKQANEATDDINDGFVRYACTSCSYEVCSLYHYLNIRKKCKEWVMNIFIFHCARAPRHSRRRTPACSACSDVSQRSPPSLQYAVRDRVSTLIPLKQKVVDDVLGGDDEWKSVPTTASECEKCGHDKAFFREVQIRSADEPATLFFRCCKCSHVRREG